MAPTKSGVSPRTPRKCCPPITEEILNYLLHQLSGKLEPIGHLDIVEDVQKQVETYDKHLVKRSGPKCGEQLGDTTAARR
jgi:hypothetical protein